MEKQQTMTFQSVLDVVKSEGYIIPTPIQALILAPTRELAAQIKDSFVTYGKHPGLRTDLFCKVLFAK
jgi:superfamily II DNA/RNA helicase